MRWLLLTLAIASCSPSRAASGDESPPDRAFYYWRTTFHLSATEQRVLAVHGVGKLYVRAFDVEWRDGSVQLAGKLTGDRAPSGIEVVPVVFVRNDVFKHHVAGLVHQVWAEVQHRMAALGATPRELQLDCDWTESTAGPYFAFVRELRAASGLAMSVTIRLHQVKYREKTGVPPVDRGMLMFYNMGSFSADPGKRAIFDTEAAVKYVGRIPEYPLPLDVALPMWSWTVQVRDDVVVDLLQTVDPDELPKLDAFVAAGPSQYRATRTTFVHGAVVREGDVLKVERTGPADTLAAAQLVAPRLPVGQRTLVLFDLSERNLDRYDDAQLETIFRAVR